MSASPRALSMGHFRKVAGNGFGDGCNGYAWSCAWFDDHVYIGTNRITLVIAQKRGYSKAPLLAYPVAVPEGDRDHEIRAEIWRYNVHTKVWQRVYRSPLTPGLKGQPVPLATGFRNMTIFQGKSDPRPALYTIPSCTSFALGPVLLRSTDGIDFEVASEHGLGLDDPNVIQYRGVVPFKGRLFIAPSGSRGANGCTSFNMTVLCSDDPARGNWQVSNPGGFGDPTNHGIFEMGVCGNYLYAGTINPRYGFQVWKTDAEGPPPHRWTLVVDRGADRGPLNEAIACFAAFQGDMYLGTGIQNGGYDRFNNIGPGAAEILRIHPDDTWDLVMGEPRMTRYGFMVPSSGFGPGFDNGLAGYIWRLRVHDGALYAGTFDASVFFSFTNPETWPTPMRRLLDRVTFERYLKQLGGCELWRTTTGDDWTPVTRNGFGNPYNWGIRSLLSTPHGFFVGTSNPFGPQVALPGPAGWHYEINPRGGTEIWHGALEHAGIESESDMGLDLQPLSRETGALPYAYLASLAIPETVPIDEAVAERAAASVERRELMHTLAELTCPEEVRESHGQFQIRDLMTERAELGRADPVEQLARIPPHLLGLSEDVSEDLAAYFGGPLRNVGYWREENWTPQQACAQLLVEVLVMRPAAEGPPATVLALGAHAEGLALHLHRLWPSARVTPGEAGAVDRAHGSSFDLVVWIEGPSATDRPQALRAVAQRLKPGGRLLATDLVGLRLSPDGDLEGALDPGDLIATCTRDLEQAGLAEVRVLEATRATWDRFFRHSREYFTTKRLFQQIDRERCDALLAALPGGGLVVGAYLLMTAIQPQPGGPR